MLPGNKIAWTFEAAEILSSLTPLWVVLYLLAVASLAAALFGFR
jgi:hypothetical protein